MNRLCFSPLCRNVISNFGMRSWAELKPRRPKGSGKSGSAPPPVDSQWPHPVFRPQSPVTPSQFYKPLYGIINQDRERKRRKGGSIGSLGPAAETPTVAPSAGTPTTLPVDMSLFDMNMDIAGGHRQHLAPFIDSDPFPFSVTAWEFPFTAPASRPNCPDHPVTALA